VVESCHISMDNTAETKRIQSQTPQLRSPRHCRVSAWPKQANSHVTPTNYMTRSNH